MRYTIASLCQCGSNGTNFDPLAWLEVEKIAKKKDTVAQKNFRKSKIGGNPWPIFPK